MRPIENSPIPQVNGVNKAFTNYQEWREDWLMHTVNIVFFAMTGCKVGLR
ncbi:hypothetical protein [Algoriphagus boritolerans]